FHFGSTITTDLANYNGRHTYSKEPTGKYLKTTTDVGNFRPNSFGLYDMHGNIWEWCQDDWHNSYTGAPRKGSVWESSTSNHKVIRGGSWIFSPGACRSASRSYYTSPVNRSYGIGFRVSCVAPRT
ncbi:MAG: formylglycine-generating enzyme family protein, partial [Phormidesmis sp.]